MDFDIMKLDEKVRTVILVMCILGMVGTGYGLALLKGQINYSNGYILGFVCGRDLPRMMAENGTEYNLVATSFDVQPDAINVTLEYAPYKPLFFTGRPEKQNATWNIIKSFDAQGCIEFENAQKYTFQLMWSNGTQ